MKFVAGIISLTVLLQFYSAGALGGAPPSVQPKSPADPPACATGESRPATVVEVVDHETLLLDDHRVVRFAGILFPQYTAHGGEVVAAGPVIAAALKSLALGREIRLWPEGGTLDRYGRTVAHVTIEGLEGDTWLQRRLVASGLAIAAPPPDDALCSPQLLKAENEARSGDKGFWHEKLFRVRQAAEMSGTPPLGNSYQIVEGVVRRVSDGKGAIYINLGPSREKSFTAVIEHKNRAAFAASMDVAHLRGNRTRLRGWLQQSRGEIVLQLLQAGQVEILDTADGGQR